jgi:hypothetical protein
MRATVIAGEKGKDDYVAIWNGIRIGHVLKVAAGTRNGRGASPSRINPVCPRTADRPATWTSASGVSRSCGRRRGGTLGSGSRQGSALE